MFVAYVEVAECPRSGLSCLLEYTRPAFVSYLGLFLHQPTQFRLARGDLPYLEYCALFLAATPVKWLASGPHGSGFWLRTGSKPDKPLNITALPHVLGRGPSSIHLPRQTF